MSFLKNEMNIRLAESWLYDKPFVLRQTRIVEPAFALLIRAIGLIVVWNRLSTGCAWTAIKHSRMCPEEPRDQFGWRFDAGALRTVFSPISSARSNKSIPVVSSS